LGHFTTGAWTQACTSPAPRHYCRDRHMNWRYEASYRAHARVRAYRFRYEACFVPCVYELVPMISLMTRISLPLPLRTVDYTYRYEGFVPPDIRGSMIPLPLPLPVAPRGTLPNSSVGQLLQFPYKCSWTHRRPLASHLSSLVKACKKASRSSNRGRPLCQFAPWTVECSRSDGGVP